MRDLARRLHHDDRGLNALHWLGIAAAAVVLLSLLPQFRALFDVIYENLVGKNNVGPDGEPAPGVLVRGIIVAVTSMLVFVGSIFFINYTTLGRRLGFLVTGAGFFGFMSIVGLLDLLRAFGLETVLVRHQAPERAHYDTAWTLNLLASAFVPLTLIVFMAWTVFWIDPQNFGPQVGVSTAAALTLIAFLLSTRQLLPRVEYLTRADVVILGSAMLVFFSLGEAVLTSNLAAGGREDLARSFDRWSRVLYPLVFAGVFLTAVFA